MRSRLAERVLRRAASLLLWAGAILLGAFGIVFSFANYPWFAIALVLLILLTIGYSERRRRFAQESRRRHRARSSDV